MKTIGLLGGMSWESTVTYYQIINEVVKQELGGLHSAKILLYSVDFYPIEKYQASDEWDKIADILSIEAKNLQKAGADFIVICANTTHKIASEIQKRIDIPIIHIAEVTAEVLKKKSIEKVILLGTKYTMTGDFYKNKLIDAGISVVVPDDSSIEALNNII
ncbi:aspartate/glutamate racemase family protein, partial [Intestinibacter sp.]|uniref:aspartate/glutamate racemase family protein n=1 Tax=Intestinibacter sp. TaxID=1965304 RepID=UPI003F1843DA